MTRPLTAEAKDHEAGVAPGGIKPDIRKVRVQCHQRTAFSGAHSCNVCVAIAGHPLLRNCDCIVPCLNEEPGKLVREILVQFEPHGALYPVRGMTRSLASSAA